MSCNGLAVLMASLSKRRGVASSITTLRRGALLVVRVTDDTLLTVDDADALSRSALELEFAETLVKLEVSTEDDELALSVALADPLVER